MAASAGARTTVFVNGRVFTGNDAGVRPPSRPGAVAVRGGRIVAVGDDSDLRDAAGPDAELVDLAGGLVMPGFCDAHVHPVYAGTLLMQCDLSGLETADEYLAEIARYAAANPDLPWITGGGWSMAGFPGATPSRHLLDRVLPDRPAFLPNRDGHGVWVNSLALRLAGIDRFTPDPPDGRIERDADGEPTGMLHEFASDPVEALLPAVTQAQMDAALLAGQRHLFSLGVTSWQDAIIGPLLRMPDNLDTYLRAVRSGALRARVTGALWWDRERGLEQLAELLERRDAAGAGRFTARSVKIMQDGVVENFTAAMTEPYLDGCGCPTGNSGLSFVEPALLREAVTALDAHGFQVHFHSLGDRAVREALDAVQAARQANGPGDHRHHLAHLQVVHPDDVPRFAQLDAVANIQPLWACHEPQMDELTIPFLGQRRTGRQYPFADLHRSGARLALGSDWSVSSADPLWGAHVAVNRVAPDARPGTVPFLPGQGLDLATVLSAYTAGSAYVMHADADAGVVAPGRLADLVTLDRDPFQHPTSEIAHARVRRTYVEGELVWAA